MDQLHQRIMEADLIIMAIMVQHLDKEEVMQINIILADLSSTVAEAGGGWQGGGSGRGWSATGYRRLRIHWRCSAI